MSNINTSVYEFMRSYRAKGNSLAMVRGVKKVSFRKFFKSIDRVAAGLYKLGVREGDVITLALPNIEQGVVAMYAASKIGAIASMIHPKLAAAEFQKAAEAHSPKAVFLSDINYSKFAPLCGNAKRILCPFLLDCYIGLPRGSEFTQYAGNGEEPAFYMQSGGTSGEPKTIVLSSRAVNSMALNLYRSLDDKFNERNAMLLAMPMFHGFGLGAGVHASLSTNMRLVLLPRFDVNKACRAIKRNAVTTMLAVPRMIDKLLASDKFKDRTVRTLEDVYVGGDSVSDELVSAFERRMKACGSTARLSPGYGLTETVTVCALSRGDFVKNSVGKPLVGIDCAVCDEQLKLLGAGEAGELLVAGEQTMDGYLNDKAASDEALVSIDGRLWVRTGDWFKKDAEGNLYFLGRKKRLIKISGMNVFPSEIERVARELPFVGECVAAEVTIGGKNFIRLFVEGSLNEAEKAEIIAHISRNLSHWHKPEYVECVDSFPRTDIGKIDFVRLGNEHRKN